MYKRLRNSFMVLFIPFLFFVLSTELYANWSYYSQGKKTLHLFNILTVLISVFYAVVFYKMTHGRATKRWLTVIVISYVTCWLVYYLVITSLTQFNNIFFAMSSILQILIVCLFLYDHFTRDTYFSDPGFKSGLWISAGLLIFNCGSAISFSLYYYINEHGLTIFGIPLYNFMPRYLSIVLYSCIAISFFTWKKPIHILSPR